MAFLLEILHTVFLLLTLRKGIVEMDQCLLIHIRCLIILLSCVCVIPLCFKILSIC